MTVSFTLLQTIFVIKFLVTVKRKVLSLPYTEHSIFASDRPNV